MSKAAAFLNDPPSVDDRPSFETILKHGHQDLVQAVAFNGHGDRCATGSVDGRIRVFNRHKDGTWRLCDTWAAHASEILEIQWLPTIIYPNLLASLGIEGRFKLWAEDPSAAQGRRFSESTRSGPLITIPARALYPHATTSHPGVPTTGPGSPAPVPPTSSDTLAGGAAAGGGGGGGAPQVKPAFELRNPRSPYRSFSIKHLDDSHITYLALLSADGSLTVYENERVENLAQFTLLDEFSTINNTSIISSATATAPLTTTATGATTTTTTATGGGTGGIGAAAAATAGTGAGGEESHQRTPRVAARGEETSFRVRFDPNPEVCYTALRAGVPSDALGLVVAVMDSVRVYRTRDMIRTSLGVAAAWKGFYLAAEVVGAEAEGVHRGLVRDVAWAPGNIRGYDIIATACRDGFVRVFRLDAVPSSAAPGREDDESGERGKWAADRVKKHAHRRSGGEVNNDGTGTGTARASLMASSAIRAGLDQSRESLERRTGNLPGRIRHVMTEISKLDSHRTPVWRVGFDDDGQILGSVGDEGKLMCYRQRPDGTWAKSSEMAMVKMKMAAP
ncbi:WD40-repeat-containing domain protein [Chaetomium strumarium]|uniref:WD40-repeat-containing domain protein n=1 Tax=Chaetomium strumarium TaxID=1170767 RepID=A0AAJ0GV14_9PEZI|nr:WD40-repeat-containing domain protein [Chaetomium strumarium]